MRDQHVVSNVRGGWSVRGAGSERATRVFATQAEAISYARDLARRDRGILYLHREDGTVKEKRSYAD
ncbi:MAG TPA: DUF2188 domain-containing protein [Allosphingosinicella sp.]|nr:DUF2188 domain-containing protein [Allosphingosinicella sp.]